MGLCTLVAIAMVHSDNRLACAIAMTLFATGIALSLLLIAAYSRPFTGEISVRPTSESKSLQAGNRLPTHRDPEHACFGPFADIATCPRHVRFTPDNGRWAVHLLRDGKLCWCGGSTQNAWSTSSGPDVDPPEREDDVLPVVDAPSTSEPTKQSRFNRPLEHRELGII